MIFLAQGQEKETTKWGRKKSRYSLLLEQADLQILCVPTSTRSFRCLCFCASLGVSVTVHKSLRPVINGDLEVHLAHTMFAPGRIHIEPNLSHVMNSSTLTCGRHCPSITDESFCVLPDLLHPLRWLEEEGSSSCQGNIQS